MTEVASWCYEPVKRELVSYDTAGVVKVKTQWVMSLDLGGVMFWESSADRTDSQSLIATAANTLGGPAALDHTLNHRNFPGSKYDNVKNGFA